jgi:hypothetical protein
VTAVQLGRVGDPSLRVALVQTTPGVFVAIVPLAAGVHQLRLVAVDSARNEADRTIDVEVK